MRTRTSALTWYQRIIRTYERVSQIPLLASRHLLTQKLRDQLNNEITSSDGRFSSKTASNIIYSPKITDYLEVSLPNKIIIRCLDSGDVSLVHLKRVVWRCLCVLELFGTTKVPDIWLVPDRARRTLPTRAGEAIEPYHVNGGYTYLNNNRTYIYRLEEWPKVILHEVLHKTSLNRDEPWPAEDLARLKSQIGINIGHSIDLNPNETIIETWAVFIQACFTAYESHIPLDDILELENRWSDNQTAKLLHHFKDHSWKETTSAFSYIVLRMHCMQNINAFLSTANKTDFIIECLAKLSTKLQKQSQNQLKDRTSLRMTWFGQT